MSMNEWGEGGGLQDLSTTQWGVLLQHTQKWMRTNRYLMTSEEREPLGRLRRQAVGGGLVTLGGVKYGLWRLLGPSLAKRHWVPAALLGVLVAEAITVTGSKKAFTSIMEKDGPLGQQMKRTIIDIKQNTLPPLDTYVPTPTPTNPYDPQSTTTKHSILPPHGNISDGNLQDDRSIYRYPVQVDKADTPEFVPEIPTLFSDQPNIEQHQAATKKTTWDEIRRRNNP